MPDPEGVRLLNVKEAAQYLGLAVQTLYQGAPEIPRIRIGRRVLFDLTDLERYIDLKRICKGKEG